MIGNFRLPSSADSTDVKYTRPSDWLSLPTVLSSDQKIVLLYAVYEHDSNFCALQCASNYTVDWGDGTSNNYAANVSAYHLYDYAYSGFVGTESTKGYRQAIVTITPQATYNLTKVDLNIKHNQSGLTAYTTGWLDIKMAGANFTSLMIGSTNLSVLPYLLEQFELVGSTSCTTLLSCFKNCTSLSNIVSLNCIGVTSLQGLFSQCKNLLYYNVSNTSSVNNTAEMFNGCTSIQTITLFDTSAVTNMSSMFIDCRSIRIIPLFNTTLVYTFQQTFSGCSSLQEVPLFNTVAATNMNFIFQNCFSLRTIPLFNTALVTQIVQGFQNCTSLIEVPLLNFASMLNISQIFQACSNLRTVPLFVTTTCTDMSYMFYGCVNMNVILDYNTTNNTTFTGYVTNSTSISRIKITNIKKTITIASLKLSSVAIVEVFNNLATVAGQTITITGNWGVSALTSADRLIATNKGWTIIG